MEAKVSEVLENILSMLSLEGSFEVDETDETILVNIETDQAGLLIGQQGQTLQSLQLLLNLIISRQFENGKRVVIDVEGWRKSKEEELAEKARNWAKEVVESGQDKELAPMPSWQRRIVHLIVEETGGVKSESVGDGEDRHLVISPDVEG